MLQYLNILNIYFQEAEISPCLLWLFAPTARWGVGAVGQQGACLFSCHTARTAATASRRSSFRSRGHAELLLVALIPGMLACMRGDKY